MKVLFLDFDGVLNSKKSTYYYYRNWVEAGKPAGRSLLSKWNWELYPIAVSNLRFISENCPDLKTGTSSTWRLGETVDYFKDMFKKNLDLTLIL